MRASVFIFVAVVAALALVSACGKRHMTKPVSGYPSECRVVFERSDATLSLAFALPDRVDLTRAPWAGNASEKILFGHLYETLITIDCTGGVRPGLAEAWTREGDGACWTFEIRKDARFWDGSRVTARDVVGSWQDALTLDTVVDSVGVVSDGKLRVWLQGPHPEVPRVFSASVFAVVKPSGDSRWPTGSGPYRVGGLDVGAFPWRRHTITVYPALGHAGPVLRFIEASAGDVRDLLEDTIDVVLTADPTVIDYAESHPRLVTVALPWDKTYALLSVSRAQRIRQGRSVAAIPPGLLDGLARDAVRGDARGHQPPSWWDELPGYGAPPVPGSNSRFEQSGVRESSASPDYRRIVYDASDPVARGLAERIAALAAVDTTRSPEAAAIARAVPGFLDPAQETIAEGLAERDFEQSLRRGDEFAYIVSLPRRVPDPYHEARELGARAPWLAGEGHRLADVLLSLVDTRSHLIAGEDTADLLIDGYGGVLVVPGPVKRSGSR